MNVITEKTDTYVKFRATTAEVQKFKQVAPNGNVSHWLRNMANCRADRVATKKPLTPSPAR